MAGRWRRLKVECDFGSMHRICRAIAAAIALHNFIERRGDTDWNEADSDSDDSGDDSDGDDDDAAAKQRARRSPADEEAEAIRIRDRIAAELLARG